MAPKSRNASRNGLRMRCLQFLLLLLGEFDKNIFEARPKGADLLNDDRAPRGLRFESFKIGVLVDEGVDRLSEYGGVADVRHLAHHAQRLSDFGSTDLDAPGPLGIHVGQGL